MIACALGAGVSAQNFRSNVLTVPVTVTVVDGSGRLITGLTQQDFEIFEDGTLQAVTTFTNERVAVSLGVLLDVSDSMRGQKIADAGLAVERFVGDLLRDEDEAFIVTLPEFGGAKTHGATYEEAARMGQDALESLIDTYQADGRELPKPATFGSPVAV